jgi:hypothetical protein
MRATACHRCGVKVWKGLDGDALAFDAVVDRTPLTLTGEALAVIAGLTTYAVDAPSRRNARRIWRRWAHQIGKPDGQGATIHAAHVCGVIISAEHVAPTTTPTATTLDPERCPF